MPIINLQKRARELGRIRLGVKETFTRSDGSTGTKPVKLDRFRLTSASEPLLEKVAELYGGTVQPWTPDGGSPAFEVITDARRLPIMVPPQPITQWHEAWRKSGCVHRCDGERNVLTDEPCNPEDPLHIEAMNKPTTRLNVVLRDVEGIGVWRVETKGWHAAIELPDVAEFLAQAGGYVNGWLALEQRTSIDTSGAKPVTQHFMVPIIEIDVTPAQLMAGGGRVAAPALSGGPVGERPALAAAGPDYVALAGECTTQEELRTLWHQAKDAGHMTQGLHDFIGKLAAALPEAAVSAPAAEAPAVREQVAVVPDVAAPAAAHTQDADALWFQITAVAGELGLTTSTLTEDFKARVGLIPDEATADELAVYLDILRTQGVAA